MYYINIWYKVTNKPDNFLYILVQVSYMYVVVYYLINCHYSMLLCYSYRILSLILNTFTGTRTKIAVLTSQAIKIANASLNFLDKYKRQKLSVPLQTCSEDVLLSNWLDLPIGSFILHLAGWDSQDNYFTYNTRINATFVPSPSYSLTTSNTSSVSLKKGIIASFNFIFNGTKICNNKFHFTAPSVSGLGIRISPSSATVKNDQLLNLTMLVSITTAHEIPGPKVVTLQASNGDQVIEATATVNVLKTEVSY